MKTSQTLAIKIKITGNPSLVLVLYDVKKFGITTLTKPPYRPVRAGPRLSCSTRRNGNINTHKYVTLCNICQCCLYREKVLLEIDDLANLDCVWL